jgi:hypothetical protein
MRVGAPRFKHSNFKSVSNRAAAVSGTVFRPANWVFRPRHDGPARAAARSARRPHRPRARPAGYARPQAPYRRCRRQCWCSTSATTS